MPRRREKYFNRDASVLTARDGAWRPPVEIGCPLPIAGLSHSSKHLIFKQPMTALLEVLAANGAEEVAAELPTDVATDGIRAGRACQLALLHLPRMRSLISRAGAAAGAAALFRLAAGQLIRLKWTVKFAGMNRVRPA
jgi:hypothetical protein